MNLLIGTSGYSYPDWKGVFYPKGVKDMFMYYQDIFPCLEINSTYYREFREDFFSSLAKRSRDGFVFSIKAFASLTHKRDNLSDDAERFKSAVMPLHKEGKLGAVLAQFPGIFRKNEDNKRYLVDLNEALKPLPLSIEIRDSSWEDEETFNLLSSNDIGYCCVDCPDLPSLPSRRCIATNETGYIRFHSRDKSRWYKGHERYDYLYSRDELSEWVLPIQSLLTKTKKTLVFFNNCHAGKATKDALELQRLLGQDVAFFDLI